MQLLRSLAPVIALPEMRKQIDRFTISDYVEAYSHLLLKIPESKKEL